ncbi:aldose epimerase family protein [Alkalihalobacillus sp. 1P02AB]|uniref:aldose epimerase family protein n=1 Tax=Alkalihalobacillus sp. 1P02AB TaxID=3132260 RepID=UPI0039A6ECBC
MKLSQKDVYKWTEYTFTNDNGMSVSVLNFGGIITKLNVPNRDGLHENIVVGYKNYEDFEKDPNYFGAIIGRVAGRIQGSSFQINDKTYSLEANNGANHLHGGSEGFHQVIWNVEPFQTSDTIGLTLSHKSLDGEGGYPGNVDLLITYTLSNDNQLTLDYQAESDQTTPLTLTNHAYFNLNGNLKETVDNHQITLDSSHFVELDSHLIPTGNILPVEDTTFDFRASRPLVDGFNDTFEQNKIAGSGYDHYFVFDHNMENQASIYEPTSGRVMTIKTNQPGMVMYTGNSMGQENELAEGPSQKHLGVCFETQGSPASLHHNILPSIMLTAKHPYKKQTVFTFFTK